MALGASRGRLIWEQCRRERSSSLPIGMACLVRDVPVAGGDDDRTNTRSAQPMMRATLSIRPVLERTGPRRRARRHASRARRVRPRARGAAGAHGRHPQRPCGCASWHPAASRAVSAWSFAGRSRSLPASSSSRPCSSAARFNWRVTTPGVDIDRLAVAALNFQTGRGTKRASGATIDRVVDEARKDQAIEAISTSTGLPFGVVAGDAKCRSPRPATMSSRCRGNRSRHWPSRRSLFRTLGIRDCARARIRRRRCPGGITGRDSQRAHRPADVWLGRGRRPTRLPIRRGDATRAPKWSASPATPTCAFRL